MSVAFMFFSLASKNKQYMQTLIIKVVKFSSRLPIVAVETK